MIVDQMFTVEKQTGNGYEWEVQDRDRKAADILAARVARESGFDTRVVTVTSTVETEEECIGREKLARLLSEYVALTKYEGEASRPNSEDELKHLLKQVNGKAISIVEAILADSELWLRLRRD
jgi:hypothetical protein